MVFLTFLSYLPALVIGDANIDGLDWYVMKLVLIWKIEKLLWDDNFL